MVANLGWVDLNLDVPLSAHICWGKLEFGRIGFVVKHNDGTSKSTQSSFAITTVTLYLDKENVH